ncbi:MAG: hypothetical protein CEN88_386 [Candidatus Berkelbacteria bacterium Licking1014_2]|uniref:DUF4012 domain-containing protein n=1 Tax=Candidatus Berkelbacteria bacterium Licking1014_2 TaxID=2017146 RepID=A0A554LTQ6_9BACT|nr:MAG: hypothetical protein CEN88_386 [Candidatus Berkelbacteria bacterium Licking1014_2]
MKILDGITKTEQNPFFSEKISRSPKKKKKISSRPFWRLGKIVLGVGLAIGLILTIIKPSTLAKNAGKILDLNGDYLVMIQNNSELRPSGGFLGTFAIVTLKNGLVKELKIDTNIYKRDRDYIHKVCHLPPEPMRQITDCWAMRDANFSPDFRASAEKVIWFYQEEGGAALDGAVAIDTTFFSELLKLTGSIDLPQYGLKVNEQNFLTTVQYEVEQGYFTDEKNKQENEPKTILKDMIVPVWQKSQGLSKWQLSKFVYRQLKEKHLLLFSLNSKQQGLIEKYNFGGAIYDNSTSDYFYLNSANIGGGKSSLNVKETVDYKVKEDNGQLIARWRLTRTHVGDGYWPDNTNKEWQRLLTPKGAELQTVTIDGQDKKAETGISEESRKAVFSWWSTVSPGKTTVIELIYQLPDTVDKNNYQLLVQKQPGRVDDELTAVWQDKLLFQGQLKTDLLDLKK